MIMILDQHQAVSFFSALDLPSWVYGVDPSQNPGPLGPDSGGSSSSPREVIIIGGSNSSRTLSITGTVDDVEF